MAEDPECRAREFAVHDPPDRPDGERLCQSIDWYSEGQTRTVEVSGIRVTIRFVGRRGRRARIAITAPAGTVFMAAAPDW